MRGLLNHVPAVPLGLLVIGLVIGVAVAAVVVGRRLVPGVREGTWAHTAGSVLEVIGAMVGLLLAFAVVIQFQFYVEAADDSRDEAAASANSSVTPELRSCRLTSSSAGGRRLHECGGR